MPRAEDGGRLKLAIAGYLSAHSLGEVRKLPREASAALWDAFILEGKPGGRHGMLLAKEAWPNARGATPVPLPLPTAFTSVERWLVFWMRERAALVAGSAFDAVRDELLMEDDEAVIAINTDSLDSLQSWGGSGQWITMRRPP